MRRLAAAPLVLVGAALAGGVAPAIASTGASIDVGSIDVKEELLPGGEYKLPTFGVRNPGTEPTNYQLVVAYMDDQNLRQPPAASGELRVVDTRVARGRAYWAVIGGSLGQATGDTPPAATPVAPKDRSRRIRRRKPVFRGYGDSRSMRHDPSRWRA